MYTSNENKDRLSNSVSNVSEIGDKMCVSTNAPNPSPHVFSLLHWAVPHPRALYSCILFYETRILRECWSGGGNLWSFYIFVYRLLPPCVPLFLISSMGMLKNAGQGQGQENIHLAVNHSQVGVMPCQQAKNLSGPYITSMHLSN